MKKIGVIGAGLGGLAAAALLAKAGFAVEVFEQKSGPGGKAGSWQDNGYRFDTGPSLLTMWPVFQQLFADCGRKIEDYLIIKPLDPVCHYFWPDGTTVQAPGTVDRFIQHFSEAGWEKRNRLERFFRHAQAIWSIAGEIFLTKSLHDWRTFFNWSTFVKLLQISKIDNNRTLAAALEDFFENPKLRQLFGRYATYNGSNPWQTPATMNIIPWVEYGQGAWDVLGGIYQIPLALEKLCLEGGVQFRYNSQVSQIHQSKGRVTAVELTGGEVVPLDGAVSNLDVRLTYRLLADETAPLARKYSQLESSSSAIVFYWSVKKSFPQLGLHNIFFSQDYKTEFAEIFEQKSVPSDPTVYVNITAKNTPGDAPKGCENWFVLINTAADQGQNWDTLARMVRAKVLEKLGQTLQVKLEDWIIGEKILTPPLIEAETGSLRGALYGISSNSQFAAFRRHPQMTGRYKNLAFCGGSVHPGGGMPLALLSGRIASEQLIRKLK